MELNREHFRTMIFYDFKSNLTPKQCRARLRIAFGDAAAPSNATIYNWFAEFKRGHRGRLNDKAREGRPATAVNRTNIDAIQLILRTDPRVTYREIQSSLGIDMKQINEILHEHLNVTKVGDIWILPPDEISDDAQIKKN